MVTDPALAASDVAIVLPSPAASASIASDYWSITKPEINFLIVITTAAGFYVSSPEPLSRFPWIPFLHTLLGLPDKSPNNLLGDGVDANDKPFLVHFPYLASPHQGYEVP